MNHTQSIINQKMNTDFKPTPRITGKVKWFNNKAGYGFVTAVDGEVKGKDIFAHYSSIIVPDDHYRYLIQGEYVDFDLTKSEKSDHEFHAANISGVKGGILMCETRKLSNDTRTYKPRVYKTPDEKDESAPLDAKPTEAPKKKPRTKTRPVEDDGFTKIPVRRQKNTVASAK